MRRRNYAILSRIAPELKEGQLARYYSSARKVKNSMCSYVTFSKLESIWHADTETEEERLFQEITKRLSHYFLREQLILAVLTSKKMSVESRPIHLRFRRTLLAFLKA